MDADDEPAPATTQPEGAPRPLDSHSEPYACPICGCLYRNPQVCFHGIGQLWSKEQLRQARRLGAKSRKRARRKECSIRKAAAEMTPSQSSAEIHRPSEEEASTIVHDEEELPDWMSQLVHVDMSCLHEGDRLSDWMSHLFEKLDLEANKDDDSTGKVAQGETHSLLEGGISSEIQRSSEEKDSIMFEKMQLEASKDGIWSTGKAAHGKTHPLLEGGISSEIQRSSKENDSTMDKLYFGGLHDDDGVDEDDVDELIDWMMKICDPPEVDQEENNPIHDASDYCKKDQYRKTIENGIKWMSEECFLAFTKSAENNHSEGIEHKFGELRCQCLSVEAYDKIFHHYNFTIEEKHEVSDVWTSKVYFAEVKQTSGLKSYLCCLLEPNDCGHCHGCKNQDMSELKHPSRGGYEEGDAGISWPFMDDPDYDHSS